jgi:hypothetical protein
MSNGSGLALPALESSRLSSEKPPPPVPNSPTTFAPAGNATPYFDYIFADAGIESPAKRGQHSPDNVSFEIDNDGELSSIPVTLGAAKLLKVVEHGMCDCDDVDHVDDAPSPEDFVPETPECRQGTVAFDNLDDASFTTRAFLQAGISVTSKGISNFLYLVLDYFC